MRPEEPALGLNLLYFSGLQAVQNLRDLPLHNCASARV
jgi:hypothetical protein